MTTRGSDLKSVSRNAPWIKRSITDKQRIYKRNIFYTMDDTSFFLRRQKCVEAFNNKIEHIIVS